MGFGVASSTTRPITVTQGTLVIDVWDASRNAMIWRSVARGALSSNPQRNAQSINQAVERAFREFPPR
jgi:ribosome recycling factor